MAHSFCLPTKMMNVRSASRRHCMRVAIRAIILCSAAIVFVVVVAVVAVHGYSRDSAFCVRRRQCRMKASRLLPFCLYTRQACWSWRLYGVAMTMHQVITSLHRHSHLWLFQCIAMLSLSELRHIERCKQRVNFASSLCHCAERIVE